MNAVACSKCHTVRPPEIALATERIPCPTCGGTSLTIGESISECASATSHVYAELIPGMQDRDWRLRWKLVECELQAIVSPHEEIMSRESIHAAQQRLLSFFILAYHLKDALKHEARVLGIVRSDIEKAINDDTRLALLADLANLDKHSRLTEPPRSGSIPVIARVSGVDIPEGGWKLSMQVEHGTKILDGLAIAEDVAVAWRERLTAWKLI